MHRFSTRNISWAALLLSMLVLVSSNLNFASSQSSEISGCANKKTGALRISNKCTASEKSIVWNIQGPQGPQGIQGVPGPQGIPGPKGDPGTTGTTTVVTQNLTQKVYDSTGALLGDYLSIDGQGSVTVNKSGSIVTYGGPAYLGNAIANSGLVYFLTNTCTGNKYASLADRSNFTIENPFVGLNGFVPLGANYTFTIGYTQGAQIDTSADAVFFSNNGSCLATSSPDAGDGPVTRIKLLTILSIPTKASPPYSVR